LDIASITGPGTAFVAGLVTSLHCAGMCGPLACFIAPRPGEQASFAASAGVYQAARLTSYTLLGAVGGLLGMTALGWFETWGQPIARFFPWAMALFFLVVALRVDQWLPKPKGPARYLHRQTGKFLKMPRPLASSLLGFFTPLLPCGPLYLLLSLALMTQDPIAGAELMLSFGLGTLPLLWLVQAGYVRWSGRLKPSTLGLWQRGLAGLVAAVLIFRIVHFETMNQNGLFCGS